MRSADEHDATRNIYVPQVQKKTVEMKLVQFFQSNPNLKSLKYTQKTIIITAFRQIY